MKSKRSIERKRIKRIKRKNQRNDGHDFFDKYDYLFGDGGFNHQVKHHHDCGCGHSNEHHHDCGCGHHQEHHHDCKCKQCGKQEHDCKCNHRDKHQPNCKCNHCSHDQHDCDGCQKCKNNHFVVFVCDHCHKQHDHSHNRCDCRCHLGLNLARLNDNLNYKLLRNQHRPLEMVTVWNVRIKGKTKHVGIDYVDIKGNNGKLMTILKDKIEYINWKKERTNQEKAGKSLKGILIG